MAVMACSHFRSGRVLVRASKRVVGAVLAVLFVPGCAEYNASRKYGVLSVSLMRLYGLACLLKSLGCTLPSSGVSLAELIRRPEIHYDALAPADCCRPELTKDITFSVEVEVKYEGYLKLENDRITKYKSMENRALPQDIPYDQITGLRIEARQKLIRMKPVSIGQASRISGVSPADIAVIMVFLEAKRRRTPTDDGKQENQS